MNLVFRLSRKPDLKEAQRLSESLDRQHGVISALVDPPQAAIYVTFDPDLTGDMALQRVVEEQGYEVVSEDVPDTAPFESVRPSGRPKGVHYAPERSTGGEFPAG